MSGRIAFTIFVSIYLAYGLTLTVFSHSGFPQAMYTNTFMPYLSDKPVGEDGFYMLTVAWNLAAKHKIVYNLNKLTTGIQPLSTFIYAALAWIVQFFNGDKWVFIRLVITFNVVSLLLFAHVLGIIAKTLIPNNKSEKYQAYVLTFTIAIFNFSLFCTFGYGLETGIYLIFIAICLLYTLRFANSRKLSFQQAIV
ncbi:MAG: hypothetical protein NTZ51_11780, partial [Proteobacteria bacterium]|nr:hypothetical protein [Pseudomonadota bacterium]